MKLPAIEELRANVQDTRTCEAIDEVLSCFYSNNLRSAIVMLYATVISDIFYKCNDLYLEAMEEYFGELDASEREFLRGEIQEPYMNPFAGIGRNDPSPCGSGKKFKKCCGRGV